MPVRVMIVDDHGVVRMGLRSLLEAEKDIQVVGEAAGVTEAGRKAAELQPDVVLMDVNLPDGSGIEATRMIKQTCPKVQVLVLTVSADQETALQAIAAGAVGYVLKDIPPEFLARAILSVNSDGTMLNPTIARRIVEHLAARQGAGDDGREEETKLTARELEVLRDVAEGLSDKEIGKKLYLSEPTIKSHLRSIFQKLHVRNRVQAAAFAVRNGLSSG